MRKITVTLSDGKPLDVRRMGLFELDNVAPDKADPGPFLYPVQLAGGTIQHAPYDLDAHEKPLARPKRSRAAAKPKDGLWWEWHEYDIYQSALAHRQERIKLARERLVAIADYILDTCVPIGERNRIETEEDWNRVQRGAIAPVVTFHDIERALETSLGANWDGQPVLDALFELPEMKGAYDSIRKWEIKLMMHLGKDEDEYSMMPITERARKIVALNIDDWMGALSSHEQSQKLKAKSK